MANEITIVTALSAAKGGALVNPGTITKQATMTNSGMVQMRVVATGSAVAFSFPGLAGAPYAVQVKNNDPTNYVEIGGDSGLTVFKVRIPPGAAPIITLPQYTTSLYHKTAGSSVEMFVTAVDQ